MEIAAISRNSIGTGDHLIVATKQECRDLIDVLVHFCGQGQKKKGLDPAAADKKAKALLKSFRDNFACY